jgi:hypothetical protein
MFASRPPVRNAVSADGKVETRAGHHVLDEFHRLFLSSPAPGTVRQVSLRQGEGAPTAAAVGNKLPAGLTQGGARNAVRENANLQGSSIYAERPAGVQAAML